MPDSKGASVTGLTTSLATGLTGGRAPFTYPDFAHYQFARMFTVLALEMQSVAVGWQVYEITKSPLSLGYVGLAQFLPGIVLFLVAGHVADRIDRRNLLRWCYAGFAVCSALLLVIQLRGDIHSAYPIYAVLVLLGVARSFSGPSSRALVPQLVPADYLPVAIAWSSSVFQAATILGPSVGGLMYAFFRGPSAVYAISMTASASAVFFMTRIKMKITVRARDPISKTTVLAGLRYIWNRKLILGLVSLDLFAVLLGGAVALLPVYAREILKTGPWGLGLLRSAPGVGASAMALLLANRPLRRRAGATMLWCVAGFGAFTIVFGLSRSLPLSLVSLLMLGGADMVSVVTRGTLVQITTPDEMRGRVNAVEMMFIGASNEFGQFESGLTAHWLGTVPAVVLGGAGALIVTGLWAWGFPELRRADQVAALEAGASD
jgi:MFS family permease